MDKHTMMKIFEDTAYVRMGGTDAELRCAQYLRQLCAPYGDAVIEPFEVPMSTVQEAVLEVDGKVIPCRGYRCAGNGDIEARFYYLADKDPHSLSLCRGKLVLVDGYRG